MKSNSKLKTLPFDLPNVEFVYFYTKPINMHWGEKKLRNICLTEMQIDPEQGGVFLFVKKPMDKLKLFFLDSNGSQAIIKWLPKSSFMMPVSEQHEIFVKIARNKLNSIFKTI
jgi:IS66 Orf2 like protein